MILLIDNYDSFTYNLYQYMGIFREDIEVVRNDKITIEEICKMAPEKIVLSPGPKSPKEAGICLVSDTRPSVRHWGEPLLMQNSCIMESSL